VGIVRSALLVVLASATAAAWGAQVYRSVDRDGNVSYSDRPAGENAEALYIATPRAADPAPPAATASQPGGQTEAAPEQPGEVQREQREPTAEERAEERVRNCAIARERNERYLISRRLYRETPDGEREYLDDAQLDDARARAAADVEEWCD
jgi:hypothetical protein